MGRHKIEAEYRLEKAQYMYTRWYIRRYPQLMQQREEILEGSAAPADGQPRGTGISNPTLSKTEQLEDVNVKLFPITAGLESIPEEYRRGVFEHIVYRRMYPDFAAISTWKRWEQRYIYFVSLYLG